MELTSSDYVILIDTGAVLAWLFCHWTTRFRGIWAWRHSRTSGGVTALGEVGSEQRRRRQRRRRRRRRVQV